MVLDSEITNGFAAMLGSIEAPPVALAQIHQRASEVAPARPRFLIPAVAAAALAVVVGVPMFTLGVAQTLEEKIAQILHWTQPPPAPASVMNAMQPQTVSLEQAQARVKFTITAPAGLPSDASGLEISVAPMGVYSNSTKTWSIGPSSLAFKYKRANGRSFTLMVGSASTLTTPPSKYIYENKGVDSAGNPILVKQEHFVWRNGDQVMSAIASDGISAAEIAAIAAAMHGTPVPTVWPPQGGEPTVMYKRIPKPQ